MNGDPAIWAGDHVELLIETDNHSYYQIVVNPAGAIMNLDRSAPKAKWYEWSSEAQVAAHIGDGFWSAEIRLPITASEEDPLHQIVGNKPFKSRAEVLATGKGTELPWHFNILRKRGGSEKSDVSAFSPPDPKTNKVHDRLRFAELYVR